MSKGRPRAELVLNDNERDTLENLLRKHSLGQSIALRGKIYCYAVVA